MIPITPRPREMVSHYQSDDQEREAVIFSTSQEISIKSKKTSDRAVLVQEKNVGFSCRFYENGKFLGYITYPNKSISYVEKAAENWVTYVMDKQTLKKYSTFY